MSAPTEEEIRKAIESCATKYGNHGQDRLSEAIMEYADDLRWRPGDPDVVETDPGSKERGDVFWRDLRPSEDSRLRTLLYEAEERATKAAHEIIIREYVTAMLTFVAEFPDAPRATREATAAT